MTKPLTDEKQLIERCRLGDARAQELLFYAYHNYVLSITRRYCGSEEEARDLLQEAFIKIFNYIHRFEGHSDFKWWLRRIVINRAIDYWRQTRVAPTFSDNDESLQIEDRSSLSAISSLQAADLLEMVQKLPQSYRIVFSLFVVEGYTHEEISAELGIAVGTSKSNLFKAKQQLQTMIRIAEVV